MRLRRVRSVFPFPFKLLCAPGVGLPVVVFGSTSPFLGRHFSRNHKEAGPANRLGRELRQILVVFPCRPRVSLRGKVSQLDQQQFGEGMLFVPTIDANLVSGTCDIPGDGGPLFRTAFRLGYAEPARSVFLESPCSRAAS